MQPFLSYTACTEFHYNYTKTIFVVRVTFNVHNQLLQRSKDMFTLCLATKHFDVEAIIMLPDPADLHQ